MPEGEQFRCTVCDVLVTDPFRHLAGSSPVLFLDETSMDDILNRIPGPGSQYSYLEHEGNILLDGTVRSAGLKHGDILTVQQKLVSTCDAYSSRNR